MTVLCRHIVLAHSIIHIVLNQSFLCPDSNVTTPTTLINNYFQWLPKMSSKTYLYNYLFYLKGTIGQVGMTSSLWLLM